MHNINVCSQDASPVRHPPTEPETRRWFATLENGVASFFRCVCWCQSWDSFPQVNGLHDLCPQSRDFRFVEVALSVMIV